MSTRAVQRTSRSRTQRAASFGHTRIGSALAALLVIVLAASACTGLGEMQFHQDHRLTIIRPKNLSKVGLPVMLQWRVSGSAAPGSGVRYAVFIDQYPMAPGKSLRSIVDHSQSCRGGDQCLTPEVLLDQFNVILTDDTHATIESFAAITSDGEAAGDSHFANIVLIDRTGNRIGESVWYVSFEVRS